MKVAHFKIIPSPPPAQDTSTIVTEDPTPISVEHPLPHGRRVVITAGSPVPIEIIAPDSAVEVAILITEEGPVVQLRGARLEVATLETLSLRAAKLELAGEQGVKITSPGSVALEGKSVAVAAEGDVKVKGSRIFLN